MCVSDIIVRLYPNHKLLNNSNNAKLNPVILLKRNFPIKKARTTVNEPRIGEKNLAAPNSDFSGTFTPKTGSV